MAYMAAGMNGELFDAYAFVVRERKREEALERHERKKKRRRPEPMSEWCGYGHKHETPWLARICERDGWRVTIQRAQAVQRQEAAA